MTLGLAGGAAPPPVLVRTFGQAATSNKQPATSNELNLKPPNFEHSNFEPASVIPLKYFILQTEKNENFNRSINARKSIITRNKTKAAAILQRVSYRQAQGPV
jgi:hypothetical protein